MRTASEADNTITAAQSAGAHRLGEARRAREAAATLHSWLCVGDSKYLAIVGRDGYTLTMSNGHTLRLSELGDECEQVNLRDIVHGALTQDPSTVLSLVWDDEPYAAGERDGGAGRTPSIIDVILEGRPITISEWDHLAAMTPPLPLDRESEADARHFDSFLAPRDP